MRSFLKVTGKGFRKTFYIPYFQAMVKAPLWRVQGYNAVVGFESPDNVMYKIGE